MALDAERSEEYPLDRLASLKSGANDVRGLIARAGRRLVQTSRAATSRVMRRGQIARAKFAAFATAPGSFGPLER